MTSSLRSKGYRSKEYMREGGSSSSILLATLLTALMALSLPIPPGALGTNSSTPTFLQQFRQKINHIVVIFMENHAYDNYFATYCLEPGTFCNGTANGIAPGTCEPQRNYTGLAYYTDPAGCPKGSIAPWNYTTANDTLPDLRHDWVGSLRSSDQGKLNGFWSAQGKNFTTFGHYNGSTIPVYWDMAEQFGIGDNVFSSVLSYSLPNHWYMLAGQAPPVAFKGLTAKNDHTYLMQANATHTIQDLLNQSPSVMWKYYDSGPLNPYAKAILPGGSAYGLWNPLAARAESYTHWYASHFVSRGQFSKDLNSSNFANISWVIPRATFSDHPPANVNAGESFVANYVDAIMKSKYWNSTAIFLTWDDFGGFYDHVSPPKQAEPLGSLGLSFRAPFVVMSPYTPAFTINHQFGYFESVLRLIELRWNLGCVSAVSTDCHGGPAGNLMAPILSGFFDFNMTPRPPVCFGLGDVYPMTPAFAATSCGSASSVNVGVDTSSWVGGDDGLNATEAD